MGTYMHMQMW